jgi:hypothetical protein
VKLLSALWSYHCSWYSCPGRLKLRDPCASDSVLQMAFSVCDEWSCCWTLGSAFGAGIRWHRRCCGQLNWYGSGYYFETAKSFCLAFGKRRCRCNSNCTTPRTQATGRACGSCPEFVSGTHYSCIHSADFRLLLVFFGRRFAYSSLWFWGLIETGLGLQTDFRWALDWVHSTA